MKKLLVIVSVFCLISLASCNKNDNEVKDAPVSNMETPAENNKNIEEDTGDSNEEVVSDEGKNSTINVDEESINVNTGNVDVQIDDEGINANIGDTEIDINDGNIKVDM